MPHGNLLRASASKGFGLCVHASGVVLLPRARVCFQSTTAGLGVGGAFRGPSQTFCNPCTCDSEADQKRSIAPFRLFKLWLFTVGVNLVLPLWGCSSNCIRLPTLSAELLRRELLENLPRFHVWALDSLFSRMSAP